MIKYLFFLALALTGCAENETCASCDYYLDETQKVVLREKIDAGDKAAAREYLTRSLGPYDHKKDFPYFKKAYEMVGNSVDLHNVVLRASNVDDIYACEDALDLLKSAELKGDTTAKSELDELWCKKQWENPEFRESALKNRY